MNQPPVSAANCWFSYSPDRQTKNYEGLKNPLQQNTEKIADREELMFLTKK